MRKYILISLILLLSAFIGFSQRDKLIAIISPQKLLIPFSQKPSVYDLLTLLEKNNIRISSPPVIIDGTIQATISGATVIFSTDKDLFTQVRSLQLVLPRLKMEDRNINEIDLRFSKVVIRY